MSIILGLSGISGAGKNLAADYLVARYGFNNTSFAYSLKESAKIIYGWDDRHTQGHLKEVVDPFWGISPRKVLQLFGTECGRDILDKDLWVKSLRRRLSQSPVSSWTISDVRFLNEITAIKSWDGKIIRIKRPSIQQVGIAGHQSETELANYDGFDFVVENDGTVADFYSKLDKVMLELKVEQRPYT